MSKDFSKKLKEFIEITVNKKSSERMKKLLKLAEEEASRDRYKDEIYEKIYGAIGEFYKAKAAENNGIVNNVKGWYSETDRLINYELPKKIIKPVNTKNRKLAIKEICDYIKSHDPYYINQALSDIQRMFGKKYKNHISDNDTDEFWNMVDSVINDTLKNYNLK